MRKISLMITACLLVTLATIIGADAQTLEKKDSEKTTVDAWRGAIPQGEQSSDAPPTVITAESRDNVEARETPAEIEKRILELQTRFMEALKKRDAATLNYLLADDFAPTEISATDSQTDKNRFIQAALKNTDLKSFVVEKTTVRSYRTAAVVTVRYKQQSGAAGAAASDSGFISTDVWVKRGKLWQAVSHHVSPIPKS